MGKKFRDRTDKVDNNNWNKVDFALTKLNFNPLALTSGEDIIEDMHNRLLEEKIHELISSHEKFSQFNDVTDIVRKNGEVSKKQKSIRKSDINEIYDYVNKNTEYTPLEVYFGLCHYFDYDAGKFLDFLSNVYKAKIIRGLSKHSRIPFTESTRLF